MSMELIQHETRFDEIPLYGYLLMPQAVGDPVVMMKADHSRAKNLLSRIPIEGILPETKVLRVGV